MPNGVIFALIAMFFWGLDELFLKEVISELKSITTYLINALSGVVLQILIVIFFFGGGVTLISGGDFLLAFAASALGFFGYIFLYLALEKQDLSLVSPFHGAWVVIAVIIGVVLLREKLSPIQVFSISAIFLGAFLISADISKIKNLRKLKFIAGSGQGALSIVFIGIAVPIEKVLIARIGEANSIVYLTTLILPLLFIAKMIMKEKFVKPTKRLLRVGIFSGLADGLAFVFYLLAISRSPVSIVAPIVASSLVVALILARVYLKEKLTFWDGIGIGLVFIGVIILSVFNV